MNTEGEREQRVEDRERKINRKNITLKAERQKEMREREGAGYGKHRDTTEGLEEEHWRHKGETLHTRQNRPHKQSPTGGDQVGGEGTGQR